MSIPTGQHITLVVRALTADENARLK
jgi:hypothetical protein